jgi:hypothetical protein
VTLSDRALTVLKKGELRVRLYTFCDNSHVQILPHADDRADDAGIVRIWGVELPPQTGQAAGW